MSYLDTIDSLHQEPSMTNSSRVVEGELVHLDAQTPQDQINSIQEN